MFRLLSKKLIQSSRYVVVPPATTLANRQMTSSVAATFAKAASPASTPTIEDLLVEITLVDPNGARRKIKGMVGKCFTYSNEKHI
jgi:hypothetical protein